MPRTATTGPAAYEAVRDLIAKGVSAAGAFKQVAADMGISDSSAAQSYYRYRKQYETGETGAEVAPRPKRGRPAGSKNKSKDSVVTVVTPDDETITIPTSTRAAVKAESNGGVSADGVQAVKAFLDLLVEEVDRLREENATLRTFRDSVTQSMKQVIGG